MVAHEAISSSQPVPEAAHSVHHPSKPWTTTVPCHPHTVCREHEEARRSPRAARFVSFGAGRPRRRLLLLLLLPPPPPPPPTFHFRSSVGMALVACPRCNITPPTHASASRSRGLLRAPRSAAASRPRPRPPPGRRLRRSRAMADYGGGHSAAAGADAGAAAPHAAPSLLVFSGDETFPPCLSACHECGFVLRRARGCGLAAWNGSVGGLSPYVNARAPVGRANCGACLVLTIGSLCNA